MKSRKIKAHHHASLIMGCGFVVTAVHHDPQIAWDAIRAAEFEMRRIEDEISSWKPNSLTTQINEASGIKSIKVSDELFGLISRSKKISALSCGAFDISGTLSRYYWNFNNKKGEFLSDQKIHELQELINYQNISLDESLKTVFLKKQGMKIGFGGIGKGYAANRAMMVMKQMGIKSGLINASGDLICWGSPPQSEAWNIKIPDPRDRNQNLLDIEMKSGSVVTSGSYENYTLIDDKRYSHIINPRTGMPVSHIKNVTVMSPDAEFSDAIATALSVLPIEEGLAMSKHLNGMAAIIIDEFDQTHFSNQLNMKAYA